MSCNYAYATLICPRCGVEQEVEVEVRLHTPSQTTEYRIGDEIAWDREDRPPGGDKTTDGYVHCDTCHKDFFVRLRVIQDRLELIDVDLGRAGHIPDVYVTFSSPNTAEAEEVAVAVARRLGAAGLVTHTEDGFNIQFLEDANAGLETVRNELRRSGMLARAVVTERK